MDCKRFRKYIGAFSDGELDVEHNLDALEHLNMCPACAARVAEVSTLRDSLRRAYGDVKAPPRLKAKIEAMMREDDRVSVMRPGRVRQVLRVFVPLAAVASLLLVVGLWRSWATAPLLRVADLPAQLVADVRHQHRTCVRERGVNHFDPTLPRTPSSIATVLGRDLRMRVAVPDLSHAGYRLIGADRCGVGRRKGSHALYYSDRPNGELSLFTVGRTAALASDRLGAVVEGNIVTAANERLAVVAWHDGPQTYLACAEILDDVLYDLVTAFRSNLAEARQVSRAVLALLK
ncbi:MAG: zf-HC2 domain-containing protein [Planctomycetes bacterium]|nr:zf-HC2 domain-containing protein [Planctomycetota bacterium]